MERPELCGVAGDLPRCPEAGSSPVGETSQGVVGEHTVETCLSLLPSCLLLLLFFSTQNIRVCAPDGDALPLAHYLPGPLPGKELVSAQ